MGYMDIELFSETVLFYNVTSGLLLWCTHTTQARMWRHQACDPSDIFSYDTIAYHDIYSNKVAIIR